MKKGLLFFGGFIFLILSAIIIIPLVVNVDKYRPEIVSVANDNLNGKLELGKLSLSLWGQVKIKIDGLKIYDQSKTKILSVEDAFFHLPFTSIFSGSPVLTLKMDKPYLYVHRTKSGNINLMKLSKVKPGAEAPQATSSSKASIALPAIVTRAAMGIELRNTLVKIVDESMDLKNEIKDLNIVFKNISLTKTTEMQIWADLQTQMGALLSVEGPFRIEGQFTPELKGMDFFQLRSKIVLNLDNLKISMPEMFEKKAGVAAHATLKFMATPKGAVIEDLSAQFHNAEIKTKIAVTQDAQGTSHIKGSVASNDVDLSTWNQLIPMLKEYDLSGIMKFQTELEGPASALNYSGEFSILKLQAKAPKLKAKPEMDFVAHFKTDQIDSMNLRFQAPGNDLKVSGKVINFKKPQITMNFTSDKGMDFDQLIEMPKMDSSSQSGASDAASIASGSGATAGGLPDYDAMIAPMKMSEMMRGMAMQVSASIPLIKFYDVKMTDIDTKFVFKDLSAGVESFKMKLWDGSISGKMRVDLKPKAPTYQMDTVVSGLNLKKSVESQYATFKNTVLGKVDFKMNGSGESFNKIKMLNSLKFTGQMKIAQASFATIDVNKMIREALNGALARLGDKIPQAKGKKINSLPEGESGYELMSSDFTIAGGKFNAPNFVAKVKPNQGVDIEGATVLNLIDYGIDAKWKIIDRYHMTGLFGISADVAGTNVQHILAEGQSQPVQFPMSVGCTMMKPCYKYADVPEHFIRVATANIGRAAEGRAKAEAARQAEELAKKHLGNDAAKKVGDLKKAFGF
ncbi:MAG: AsmA family protein [Xanthomonadaceae bacterium]|nr:AsmA family protein [Xanthomonadaceae bacterium]